MIFKGRYSQTNWNNPLAPFVEASVRAADEKWIDMFFLIDLGADGTYLPSKYMKELGIQLEEARIENDVTGVGGQRVEYIPFITQLKFESNGDLRIFDLSIGVFTQEESLDIPILGRDVMNFFTLLCDLKANLVWLIDEADRMKLLRFCDEIERHVSQV
ncbi:hypothetical protein FJZ31_34780 [Candidatus Poribacteria bacterium]|nr:hypothetical protein [Candidatus Poribacteria bacterium]